MKLKKKSKDSGKNKMDVLRCYRSHLTGGYVASPSATSKFARIILLFSTYHKREMGEREAKRGGIARRGGRSNNLWLW